MFVVLVAEIEDGVMLARGSYHRQVRVAMLLDRPSQLRKCVFFE